MLILGILPAIGSAADIRITLPPALPVLKAEAACQTGQPIEGTVQGNTLLFKNPVPATPYDLSITLKDGTVLQGVNLAWYALQPDGPPPDPPSDDDRQQIADIVNNTESFFNKTSILLLTGNHDRMTALVQLLRDKPFHSDTGDEIIWHVELWYFENQHGGWEKVPQVNKLLRRQRFPNRKAFQDTVSNIRWIPQLGGLKVDNNQSDLVVKLEEKELKG